MASDGRSLRRLSSNSGRNLLPRVDLRTLINESPYSDPHSVRSHQFASLRAWECKALGFSRRFTSGVSVKWRRTIWKNAKSKNRNRKKKRKDGDADDDGEERWRIAVSGCLTFYGKGGGCRVGSCEELEIEKGRGLNCGEAEAPAAPSLVPQGNETECFLNGVSEMLSKMSTRKGKENQRPRSCAAHFPLPDDVLEMCLLRLPLSSLAAARLVCKKWNSLATSPHFTRMRSEGSHLTPWLFLFSAGEICALDVCLDRWHRIALPAIQDRFSFSVASLGDGIYVVGGRSAPIGNDPVVGRSSLQTHRGVFLFSPLTGSLFKAASMNFARSGAVLGVLEVGSGCPLFAGPQSSGGGRRKREMCQRGRVRGASDVYEDPHRCSLRRQIGDGYVSGANEAVASNSNKASDGKKKWMGGEKRHVLIAVGGHGCWDEPLDSGEIYDPITNRWSEMAKLPAEFGAVCSGAACGGVFYVCSELDKVAFYDLSKGFWVAIQTYRIPTHLREYHPKLVSCKGRLFMLSVSWSDRDARVIRREKAVRKLWELNPILHSWTEVSRHPDAPMDWGAAFVANGNDIYGVEMFKIFGQVLDFITVCNVSDMGMKWSRISRKHSAHEADAASCVAKTVAVLQL